MKKVTEELQRIVAEYTTKISSLPEKEFAAKPLPNKWSKKEVLGHLIDSAQNNLRRFICGQYENSPPHIIYEQDFWVSANAYGQAKSEEVIQLWQLINQRIYDVIDPMPVANYSNACNTGRTTEQLHSIEWLAEDYVKHMKHHLNQIIPNSFDIVYK